MDVNCARMIPAPASRPAATRVLEPIAMVEVTQPALPWAVVPEVISTPNPVDPAVRRVAAAITLAIVEVLSGQRPLAQLERVAHPDLVGMVGHLSRARAGAALRVHSIRIQAPEPGVIEVAAHLRVDAGSRAAALRLQRREDRWLCTHLEIALRPDVVNRAG